MSDRVGSSPEGVSTARDTAVVGLDGGGKDPNFVIDNRVAIDPEILAWAKQLGAPRGWSNEKVFRNGLQALDMFLAAKDLKMQVGVYKDGVYSRFEIDFGGGS
ncbi:hypothetical protein [Geodermatophilus poikilotrophus]|uniref:hypothetical protein n=1 Tax=Geodermatophilus poikilotrophus TaxID=1333667 RepID=UPI0011143B61|nr:hypothetical protein [Geodermatophilus poikilotrophus]